jgi:hypothetical protein
LSSPCPDGPISVSRGVIGGDEVAGAVETLA